MHKQIATSALLMASMPAMGGDFDIGASVGTELRTFFEDGAFPGQFNTFQPSLQLEGDLRWQSDSRTWDMVIVPYARIDGQDDRRSHFDMREAYLRWSGDEWTVRAGLAKVFWGVAESRHLVDIINQYDAVEDIDEEDKLGQPMLEVSTIRDWGQVTGYVMPFFRKRTFPGLDGRLRFPGRVDNDLARFDGGDTNQDVDFALRYSHYIGDWDVGLSFFHGASREPRLVQGSTPDVFIPFYDDITQVGLDLQYTKDAWLWKFEGIIRDTPFETFEAAVGGFEYTFYGVTDAGADLGFLMEYQYDGRSDNFLEAAPTIANNDLFVGARLALNDAEDTDFLGGFVTDTKDGSISGLVEASRRFGDNWVLEVESRFFANADSGNLLSVFRRDSHFTLRLTRYF